jgi:hypothetical protein
VTASSPLQFDFAALRSAEPDSLTVEEQAGLPGRFEVRLADPGGELWRKTRDAVGTIVRIQLDAGPEFHGVIWSRRLTRDAQKAGTILQFWGFDASYRLRTRPRYRSFGLLSLKEASESICRGADLKVHFAASPTGRLSRRTALVQYGESDFDFLRRLAALCGWDLWPYRGELFIGEVIKPNQPSMQVTLEEDGRGGGTFVLEESWCQEAAGDDFPMTGVPFPGGPGLQSSCSGHAAAGSGQNADAQTLTRLGIKGLECWPAGLAQDRGEQQALSKLALSRRRDGRWRGVIPLPLPLPDGLVPGSRVDLRLANGTLADALKITGIAHHWQGLARHATVRVGQLGDLAPSPIDRRLAVHLWPAQVAGNPKKPRGCIDVKPLGWAEDSRPLPARILCFSAIARGGTIHLPAAGELVLMGFEGGNPDAPVILGGLHDGEAPGADPGGLQWVWKHPEGGEVRFTVQKNQLLVVLENMGFSVIADQKSEIQVLNFDSTKAVLELKSGKIDMKKA